VDEIVAPVHPERLAKVLVSKKRREPIGSGPISIPLCVSLRCPRYCSSAVFIRNERNNGRGVEDLAERGQEIRIRPLSSGPNCQSIDSHGFVTGAPLGFLRLNSAMNAAVTSIVGSAVRTAGSILLTSRVIVMPCCAANSSKALPIC